jgi:hypothetical protein
VEYESISASGSTRVSVRPGGVPFICSMGVCFSCSFPPLARAGMGHDYELWPVCPGVRVHALRRSCRLPRRRSSTALVSITRRPSRSRARVLNLPRSPLNRLALAGGRAHGVIQGVI